LRVSESRGNLARAREPRAGDGTGEIQRDQRGEVVIQDYDALLAVVSTAGVPAATDACLSGSVRDVIVRRW
jgi:hypothetical protein